MRFSTTDRNDPKVRSLQKAAARYEGDALAIRREARRLVDEGAIRKLFRRAAGDGQKVDVVPTGVLKDGSESCAVGRPFHIADRPAAAAISG
jgi:hypothetical protein